MRLATVADRDDERAHAVLLAAIDAGVTTLDTADAYALAAGDVGHGELQCARALTARPDARVRVITKGGLTRPGSAWLPDGRASSLAAAARASRERLGGAPIDLYLLHAVDPRVELATSVRALRRLVDDGVVRAIGLANVGRVALEAACALAPIAAVQIELGPHQPAALVGGLVRWCRERGIEVLAHRPLGGPERARRLASDRVLAAIAARHQASAVEVALAWLAGQGVLPLPGATSVDHAVGAARAGRLVLDEEAVRALDARWLDGGAGVRIAGAGSGSGSGSAAGMESESESRTGTGTGTGEDEIVIVMGLPGAGKSTLAGELIGQGYLRLNRDLRGGTLAGIAVELERALAGGARRIVLDNTYPTRASRATVIAAGRRHRVPVRCLWLDTAIEDAQVNACLRLLAIHGGLPEPDELRRLARREPGTFGPGVQFDHRRALEPPGDDEGFAAVEVRRFVRTPDDRGARGLVVDVDDLVRVGRPTSPADVRIADGAAEAIAAWRAAGWLVVGTAWQPALAGPTAAVRAQVDAIDARTRELLAAPLAIATCWHPAGPPRCWCRKPLPGLGLALARAHGLALARSIVVGHVDRAASDRGFATRVGAGHRAVERLTGP
jgi:diketogulonate reductase-like aldo/keto reductase/histidinol phosphatase-like enzyme